MAIATNVAHGTLADVEPDTLTGVNHYPRLYYSAVGMLARVTGLHPVAAWNLGGLIVQVVLVGTLATVLVVLTRRWWTALLAPLPFILGTFAWTRSDTGWFTSLESHAVLWGPFGVLYSLNGETAGLCVGTAALVATAATWLRPTSVRVRVVVATVSALTIGLTANFQTYSFLTLVYVACYALAATAIWHRRSVVAAAVSAGLVVALFVVGPHFAEAAGQLPTLVLGLTPSAPGLILLALSSRWRLLGAVALAALAAAPQLVWTMSGILGGDPFLSYRVGSNVNLGVGSPWALVGAAGVLVPTAAVIVLAVLRRRRVELGIATGYLVATAILVVNDRWGANAEPYRFWIDTFLIGAVLQLVLLASLLTSTDGGRDPAATRSEGQVGDATPSPRRPRVRSSGRVRTVGILAVVSLAAVTAAGLPDFLRYRSSPEMTAVWDPTTPREEAIGGAAAQAASADSGLVLAGPCVDPRRMKVTSGAPVAYFHLGMAWPERYDEITRLLDAANAGFLDVSAARDSEVGWVVTDSACEATWDHSELAEVDRFGYDDAEIVLWRLEPGSA
ncbi:hypothetical protein C8046_17175 [Serinibacter arcticus]|uniref:Transmembrane protein n=1 Tax=Serinibacter arcticus TaxID=1655435 RepID=A0A2U1ZYS0_9MICO|nr:hypothetical protein [Serinibacter arcticus]PWD52114.1 hypothetical protein C8046_17175 [Serinibacter arcticus]